VCRLVATTIGSGAGFMKPFMRLLLPLVLAWAFGLGPV
jgi:hypothetical protein